MKETTEFERALDRVRHELTSAARRAVLLETKLADANEEIARLRALRATRASCEVAGVKTKFELTLTELVDTLEESFRTCLHAHGARIVQAGTDVTEERVKECARNAAGGIMAFVVEDEP